MFSLRECHTPCTQKLKVALKIVKEELSIIGFAGKYKVNPKEAREFKKWCRENYYYKSYKTPCK